MHSLTGMGTTAAAWEAARARTMAERVNFMIVDVFGVENEERKGVMNVGAKASR